MSKERLEEIKNKYKEDVYDCKLGRFDIFWLIEQAEQEHATSVQNTKLAVEFERLQLENKRYREALEFYADEDNYDHDVGEMVAGVYGVSNCEILDDYGERAQEALESDSHD